MNKGDAKKMKQNYNPVHLSKKQRHMKKWIPDGIYCHGTRKSKRSNYYCPFWYSLYNKYTDNTYEHKRSECCFSDVCKEDCSQCTEDVSKCTFLNYIEYGEYPLGDMCKVCKIHDYFLED